jgi:hypothetical protein
MAVSNRIILDLFRDTLSDVGGSLGCFGLSLILDSRKKEDAKKALNNKNLYIENIVAKSIELGGMMQVKDNEGDESVYVVLSLLRKNYPKVNKKDIKAYRDGTGDINEANNIFQTLVYGEVIFA